MAGLYKDTAPTWLSRIIDDVLMKHYFLGFRRVNKISEAILNSPQGKGLKDADVKSAVRAGLEAGEVAEHEHEHNPTQDTASPSHVAAQVIATILHLENK
jgi:hypothetical protein